MRRTPFRFSAYIACIVLLGGLAYGLLHVARNIENRELVPPERSEEGIPITIGDTMIYAEIADTDAARVRGLSGHAPLQSNEGMFFIFDTMGRQGFWMKDMTFSIDIIWIDDLYRVVDITKAASPDSFPEVFYPKVPMQYVLEVKAGFAEEHNITVGEKITFGEEK